MRTMRVSLKGYYNSQKLLIHYGDEFAIIRSDCPKSDKNPTKSDRILKKYSVFFIRFLNPIFGFCRIGSDLVRQKGKSRIINGRQRQRVTAMQGIQGNRQLLGFRKIRCNRKIRYRIIPPPPEKFRFIRTLKISCQNTIDYPTPWPTILNVIPIWYLIQSRKQDPFITGIQVQPPLSRVEWKPQEVDEIIQHEKRLGLGQPELPSKSQLHQDKLIII